MVRIATGLPREDADHWLAVLADAGIDAHVTQTDDGSDLDVDEASAEAARALFASPFDEPDDEPREPGETALAPTIGDDERTEPLARTADVMAAQRLALELERRGVAVLLRDAPGAALGLGGAPEVTVSVATRQRDEAFAALKAIAAELPGTFAGAAQIDPLEVLEALALAPAGLISVRPLK